MAHEKVALITGSSRGIGRAIAEKLGADGISVVVNYQTNEEAAAKAVAAIEANGGHAVAAQANVLDPQQLRGLFDTAEQHFGGLDVFVNNVGIGGFAPMAAATDEDFDNIFATNTRATFVALREAARRLRDAGRIIVISSGIAMTHGPGTGIYGASKAAGDAMALTLAKELGPRGVTVNSVLPSVTRTDAAAGLSADIINRILAQTPLGRLGEPEDIADIVAFLVSDQGRWVTGQTINAGGGMF